MYFDKRYVGSQDRVAQCYAGVREGGGIDEDEIDTFVAGVVQAFDQFIFGIALQVLQVMSGFDTGERESGIDIGEGFGAVDSRFSGSQHVQVRSVQYKYRCHDQMQSRNFKEEPHGAVLSL
jgi:hypothetical protein